MSSDTEVKEKHRFLLVNSKTYKVSLPAKHPRVNCRNEKEWPVQSQPNRPRLTMLRVFQGNRMSKEVPKKVQAAPKILYDGGSSYLTPAVDYHDSAVKRKQDF